MNDQPWEIAEFEIYGQDYVSEASYTYEIMDFEEAVAWERSGGQESDRGMRRITAGFSREYQVKKGGPIVVR